MVARFPRFAVVRRGRPTHPRPKEGVGACGSSRRPVAAGRPGLGPGSSGPGVEPGAERVAGGCQLADGAGWDPGIAGAVVTCAAGGAATLTGSPYLLTAMSMVAPFWVSCILRTSLPESTHTS